MAEKLTERQKRFVDAFMHDANATSAAKSAGYSDASAHVRGHELRKHPIVAAEIARRGDQKRKKFELNAESVIETLSGLVSFDIASLYDKSGKLLNVHEMPIEARNAIASIDGDKVKLISRLGSLELSSKLLGMVKEQQTQQQAVQIIISAPTTQLDVAVERKQLLPEWE